MHKYCRIFYKKTKSVFLINFIYSINDIIFIVTYDCLPSFNKFIILLENNFSVLIKNMHPWLFSPLLLSQIFSHLNNFAETWRDENQKVLGQESKPDASELPSWVPLIYAGSLMLYVAVHCHGEIWHLFSSSILAIMFEVQSSNCLIVHNNVRH